MFKRIKSIAQVGLLAVVGLIAVSAPAHAVDLTGVSLDTATVVSLAAMILTALGVIWGVRRAFSIMR